MNCGFVLLLSSLAISLEVSRGDRENAEIVYPERIHFSRSKRDLSTELEDSQDEDSLSIKIKSRQGDMIIDLKKNKEIYPGSLLLRTYNDDGEAQHELIKPRNCRYEGSIRDRKDSSAFISTCNGLTGSLDTGDGLYDIEPHDDQGGHKYYRVDDEIQDIRTQLSMSSSGILDRQEDQQSTSHKITTVTETAKSMKPYELIDVEDQYIPYLTTNHTRYVEMFVSADDKLYRSYNNDTDLVLERILNAVAQVDKSYSAINIRLVVVAMEIQTNGPSFTRSVQAGEDLSAFNKHYQGLKKEDAFKNIRIDNAHLFSHHAWESRRRNNIPGLAYLGTICRSLSVAITAWSYKSISGPTVTVGHELGHNIGFFHDKLSNCTCLSKKGCFMGGDTNTTRPGFSDCNMRTLAKRTYPCMNDYPMNPITSRCGNGIKEKDEECDCGTLENCKKNDPCCKPHDCKLKEEAQCNFVNNPLCCNQTCQFKKQGTMCREASSNCDAPEYCTGDVATCPSDQVMVDGTPCGESKKLLLGTLNSKRTTRELTPRVVAQYFKIIPVYWEWGGLACMKLEMEGCDLSQDSSTVPTSISTPGLYKTSECLTPDITSCQDVKDGTQIMYRKSANNDCNHPHMLFVHKSDGTLIHHCTGKKVCPRDDNKYLVLSSTCVAESAIYVRTEEGAIKHVSTNRCIGARGRPKTGRYAILKKTCNATRDRSKLIMRNHDCRVPLGFQNGNLPETAFSAGSVHKARTLNDIRLNKRAWCPVSYKDGSWFQIDFGKKVEVRYITLAGLRWNSVSAYYLMYSDNGKLWKYYKESGVTGKDTNSHCYLGTCADTYDHQCQYYWDADATSASDKCWNKLNTGSDGYGTCNPTAIEPCSARDVKCGQIQCTSPLSTPYYENYGRNYTKLYVDGETCSATIIVGSNDEVGLGMVDDGTKCGDGKMCFGEECKTIEEHGRTTCPSNNGKTCDGKGLSLNNGNCLCDGGYDPETACSTVLAPVDGGWSAWSPWTSCTKTCNTGKRRRHRFCNSPAMKHDGKDCYGERVVEEDCNEEACIE